MTDLFSKAETQKQLEDFDAVWPASETSNAIIEEFRRAYKAIHYIDAPNVTYQGEDTYTVHFSMIDEHDFTSQQLKDTTKRLMAEASAA